SVEPVAEPLLPPVRHLAVVGGERRVGVQELRREGERGARAGPEEEVPRGEGAAVRKVLRIGRAAAPAGPLAPPTSEGVPPELEETGHIRGAPNERPRLERDPPGEHLERGRRHRIGAAVPESRVDPLREEARAQGVEAEPAEVPRERRARGRIEVAERARELL